MKQHMGYSFHEVAAHIQRALKVHNDALSDQLARGPPPLPPVISLSSCESAWRCWRHDIVMLHCRCRWALSRPTGVVGHRALLGRTNRACNARPQLAVPDRVQPQGPAMSERIRAAAWPGVPARPHPCWLLVMCPPPTHTHLLYAADSSSKTSAALHQTVGFSFVYIRQ